MRSARDIDVRLVADGILQIAPVHWPVTRGEGRDEEERREVVHVDERLDHLYGEVSGQVMGGERRECATREFVRPLRITAE